MPRGGGDMTKRRLAGFAVGFFSLLTIVLVYWLTLILFGYTLPKWLIAIAVVVAVISVQYLWR